MRAVLLLACLSATAFAGTFHVAPGGDDAASGGSHDPWRTLQRALGDEAVGAGTTIEVAPGVYEGPIVIARGGTWREPLVVRAARGAELRVGGLDDAVEIAAAGPVVFDGFAIRSASGAAVRVSSESSGIVVRNLSVRTDGSGDGIVVERAPGALIERNTVLSARYGIVVGGPGTVIRNNVIADSARAGALLGRDRYACDVILRNNTFLDNGCSMDQPGALWLQSSRGVRIENNIFVTGAGRRVMTVDSTEAEFSHNLYFSPASRAGLQFSHGGNDGFGFEQLRLCTADGAAMFADPQLAGFRPRRTSPAIDAGAGRPGPVEFDRDGNARSVGLSMDIGAFEFPQSTGLRVVGNQLVHQNRIIRLRGIGVGDPILDRRERPFSDYRTLRELWNANAVRMSVHPYVWRHAEEFGGRDKIIEWFRNDIDAAVRAGLYVILDWHITGWPNGFARESEPGEVPGLHDSDFELAKDFWERAASEFGQNGMVAFELWNEPVRGPGDWKPDPTEWADLRPWLEELTRIVRKHSDNLLIVSGGNWAYCLRGIRQDPPADGNTAIAWHVYAGKELNDEARWAGAFDELSRDFPVLVTEWGFDVNGKPHYRGGVDDFAAKFASRWLEGRGLHWVAWCWHPSVGPALIEEDWSTPTEFGRFVAGLLRANPGGAPPVGSRYSPVASSSPAYNPFMIR